MDIGCLDCCFYFSWCQIVIRGQEIGGQKMGGCKWFSLFLNILLHFENSFLKDTIHYYWVTPTQRSVFGENILDRNTWACLVDTMILWDHSILLCDFAKRLLTEEKNWSPWGYLLSGGGGKCRENAQTLLFLDPLPPPEKISLSNPTDPIFFSVGIFWLQFKHTLLWNNWKDHISSRCFPD